MPNKIHMLRGTFRTDTVRDSEGDGAKIVTVRMAQVGVRSYFYETELGEITEMREALLPQELFSKDTLESAKGSLVTHYHPWRLLNADNWDLYSKGVTVGEPWVEDNKYLCMDVKVFDTVLQAFILSGLCDGCSIGFTQQFVPEQGEFEGIPYDGYNKDVRINHLAFCAREDARGGEDLGVKLDTKSVAFDSSFRADSHTFDEYKKFRKDSKKDGIGGAQMRTVRVDGKDFEVADEIAVRIDTLEASEKAAREDAEAQKQAATENATRADQAEAREDALKTNVATLEAEKADLQGRLDAMPSEEAIVANMELAGFVSKITGETESYKTDSKDLRTKALQKLFPEEKFDTRSEAYLEARLDMVKEQLDKEGYPTVAVTRTDSTESRVDTKASMIDGEGRAHNHFSNKK